MVYPTPSSITLPTMKLLFAYLGDAGHEHCMVSSWHPFNAPCLNYFHVLSHFIAVHTSLLHKIPDHYGRLASLS